jgi:hypothetical protein
MACVAPDAQLTAEEKQCCKEMGGGCQPGESGMPMSHSCCKASVQPRNDFRPSATISLPAPSLAVSPLELPAELPLAEQSRQFISWVSQSHAPPEELLDASAPLRI